MAKVTIPAATKVTLNGIEVEFSTDCLVDVVKATSVDHAAELGVEKALGAHLTHIEDGVEVSYVSGKRSERTLEEEKPKAKAKTKAKPKG